MLLALFCVLGYVCVAHCVEGKLFDSSHDVRAGHVLFNRTQPNFRAMQCAQESGEYPAHRIPHIFRLQNVYPFLIMTIFVSQHY